MTRPPVTRPPVTRPPMTRLLATVAILVALAASAHGAPAHAANDHHAHGAMGGMAMKGPHDRHMRLTPRRKSRPGDRAKVREIARRTKRAIAKYKDLAVARRDGYRPFGDGPDAKIVHFVHVWRSAAENWRLNPEKPGALLYRKTGGDYRLIGAMFVAPDKASMKTLNERVPLSQARWHIHTNICTPRPIWSRKKWALKHPSGAPLYGPDSPISTRAACKEAKGRFHPTIFGWMVHVYPWREPAMQWHEDGH